MQPTTVILKFYKMNSLLDNVDRTVNPDQPLLQGLTNAGPANLGTPMPLAVVDTPAVPSNLDVFRSSPAMVSNLQAYDEDEDSIFPDTDPMHFDDDDIFETSPFLGLGNKQKRAARKAKRQERRAERKQRRADRRAAKNAEIAAIGTDSPWNQPNEITPESYGAQAEKMAAIAQGVAPSEAPLLQSVNAAPAATNQLYNQLASQRDYGTGFENELAGDMDLTDLGSRKNNTAPKNKTMLYVGIAAVVLVVVLFILKNRK